MFASASTRPDRLQSRLLVLAALFLGLYALILSLSPAVLARSWAVDFIWGHWLGYVVWLGSFGLLHWASARYLPRRDPYLLPVAATLTGWGLLTIWRLYPSFGLRQTIWLAPIAVLIALGMRLPGDLTFLRRYKYLWLTGGLILTAMTLLLGTNPTSASGPHLWLGCCGVYFQPSEPLKLLLIVYLSAYLADRPIWLSQVEGNLGEADINAAQSGRSRTPLLPLIAPTLIMTGLALLLLLVQRDMGTATIFIFLFATMIYLATGRVRLLFASLAVLVLSGLVGYLLFDVVRIRVDAWINPWLDPSGRSYQIVQSLLAIANGGLFGRGPGLGNPRLVPIPHSDFIFAAIAEETGLVGVAGLCALLAVLAWRGLVNALHAPDRFRRYLAAGLTAYLAAQSILIISGNLRLLPLTGVTLPFVSYGGSSLLTVFIALLLMLHVSNRGEEKPAYEINLRPYLSLGGFLFSGIAAVSLVTGWWAYYRGPDLLERTDNARRAIADRYVPRGEILDRSNEPLASTEGVPGELVRSTDYPDLGSIIGYTYLRYGQSGLEATLDPYLRGLRGYPGVELWWNHLLYGQPPPGLDVRLSLDLNLQRAADDLLGSRPGALVLLNADSGEILAIASHPTFDPNRLEEDWELLISDPGAPLFNRATLGRYPPGAALGPLLFAAADRDGAAPRLPGNLDYTTADGRTFSCARLPEEPDWESALAGGCPSASVALARSLGLEEVLNLYVSLGFYTSPQLRLPSDSLDAPHAFVSPEEAVLGLPGSSDSLLVNPLQMALAAASLSAGGVQPPVHLVNAVDTPQSGWESLPPLGESAEVLPPVSAEKSVLSLAAQGLPIWQTLASSSLEPEQPVTWYLAGTSPNWNGAPLSLAVLLEEANPDLAEVIGRSMLQTALTPVSN